MPLTDEVHPSAVLAWVEGARLADALLQQHPFMQFSRSFLFTTLRAFRAELHPQCLKLGGFTAPSCPQICL